MKRGLTTAAATAMALTFAGEADANNSRNCAERDQVVSRLAEGYGETRQSIGLGANNSLVEVFASNETGTWTITVTAPGGKTCLVATGQAFEKTKETLEPAKEDANLLQERAPSILGWTTKRMPA